MKKFMILILALIAGPMMADNLALIGKGGGSLVNNSKIGLGDYPGAISYVSVPMTAQAAITVGMPVKLNTDSSVWYNTVSKCVTAGDQAVIGIAQNTAAAGATVNVAISGICLARFAANTTVGVMYSPTTAGDLTPTSTLSETVFTNLSKTSGIVRTLETKTIGSDGLARVIICR